MEMDQATQTEVDPIQNAFAEASQLIQAAREALAPMKADLIALEAGMPMLAELGTIGPLIQKSVNNCFGKIDAATQAVHDAALTHADLLIREKQVNDANLVLTEERRDLDRASGAAESLRTNTAAIHKQHWEDFRKANDKMKEKAAAELKKFKEEYKEKANRRFDDAIAKKEKELQVAFNAANIDNFPFEADLAASLADLKTAISQLPGVVARRVERLFSAPSTRQPAPDGEQPPDDSDDDSEGLDIGGASRFQQRGSSLPSINEDAASQFEEHPERSERASPTERHHSSLPVRTTGTVSPFSSTLENEQLKRQERPQTSASSRAFQIDRTKKPRIASPDAAQQYLASRQAQLDVSGAGAAEDAADYAVDQTAEDAANTTAAADTTGEQAPLPELAPAPDATLAAAEQSTAGANLLGMFDPANATANGPAIAPTNAAAATLDVPHPNWAAVAETGSIRTNNAIQRRRQAIIDKYESMLPPRRGRTTKLDGRSSEQLSADYKKLSEHFEDVEAALKLIDFNGWYALNFDIQQNFQVLFSKLMATPAFPWRPMSALARVRSLLDKAAADSTCPISGVEKLACKFPELNMSAEERQKKDIVEIKACFGCNQKNWLLPKLCSKVETAAEDSGFEYVVRPSCSHLCA